MPSLPNLQKYRTAAAIPNIREWLLDRSAATSTGCREWRLALGHNGYGVATPPGMKQMMQAHRLAHMVFNGDIPEGDNVVDHKCLNRKCILPAHLQILTRGDNTRQADRYQSPFCKRGHRRTVESTYVWTSAAGITRRACRICRAAKADVYYANRRAKLAQVK